MFPRITGISRSIKLGSCPLGIGHNVAGGGRQWSNLPSRKTDRFIHPEGVVAYEEDYTETPEYPEIDPETHQWSYARKQQRKAVLDWHAKIRDAPNPEAKTLEINMMRHYGYFTYLLQENNFDYDSQEFYKFLTQTHIASTDSLPDAYSNPELTKKAQDYAEKLKDRVLETLQFELYDQKRCFDNNLAENSETVDYKRSLSIITQLNRVILSELGKNEEHLKYCQVDHEPKIEAFWFSGGHALRESEAKYRKASEKYWEKQTKFYKFHNHKPEYPTENDPIQRCVQYKGNPLLQIRCDQPITNFVDPTTSELCQRQSTEPRKYPYPINTHGIFKEYRYASIIPGTWAGDSHNCSHIAFHPRHYLQSQGRKDNKHWIADTENLVQSQGLLSTFGRLFGQALYYGFDQFSDLDYPFSSQTVITDGINFSFLAYQLNTIKVCGLYLNRHNKQNVCWKTNTMSILDKTQPGGDAINKETLETLIKFYLNPTSQIPAKNPTPYLKSSINNMEDEIEREVIWYNYRDMVSQRWYVHDNIKQHQYPEIYEWEKIYKIRHPQRPVEPRRRFFELPRGFPGRDPNKRTYELIDPRKIGKRMRFLMAEVAAKKEAERIESAKEAEKAKYERSKQLDDYNDTGDNYKLD